MSRVAAELRSDSIGTAGTVIRYGHSGRPVLVFPAEQGRAADFEAAGMVDAAGGLISSGRVKLYCVDSFDAASWSNQVRSRLPHSAAASAPSTRRTSR